MNIIACSCQYGEKGRKVVGLWQCGQTLRVRFQVSGYSLVRFSPIFLSVTVSLASRKIVGRKFYRRYVDDTFSLFCAGKTEGLDFLELLNSLHPSLSITMEAEENGSFPFWMLL